MRCAEVGSPGINLAILVGHGNKALGKLGHMARCPLSAHVAIDVDVVADVMIVCGVAPKLKALWPQPCQHLGQNIAHRLGQRLGRLAQLGPARQGVVYFECCSKMELPTKACRFQPCPAP